MEVLSYIIIILTILYGIYRLYLYINNKTLRNKVVKQIAKSENNINIDWRTHSKPDFTFPNIQSRYIDY